MKQPTWHNFRGPIKVTSFVPEIYNKSPLIELFEEMRILILTGLRCEAIGQLPFHGHTFILCSSTQNCKDERKGGWW